MPDKSLDLLADQELAKVCERFIQEADNRRRDCLGFNAFSLVSDLYYRENFHSDVLHAFLDMHGKHGSGSLYLHEFIGLLLAARPKDPLGAPKLRVEDFSNYETMREDGRIDVLIQDKVSRKAIIIENKINGAGDQERQLPRYLEDVEGQARAIPGGNYKVVAIVYLSMTGRKYPADEWTAQDRAKVEPLLITVGAYTNGEAGKPDMVDHWLKQCIERTIGNNPIAEDARALLRQYQRLLIFQGAATMNSEAMAKFYDLIIDGDKHKQVQALTEMFGQLDQYFLHRLVSDYSAPHSRHAPFGRVGVDPHESQCLFQQWRCGDTPVGISLLGSFVEKNEFVWSFLDEHDVGRLSNRVGAVLDSVGLGDEYANRSPWPTRYQSRRFARPTSPATVKAIRDFLDSTLKELRKVTRANIAEK